MIEFLVVKAFFLLLLAGIMLPSDGNHGIFAPKSLAFLNAAFFFGVYYITRLKLSYPQTWAFTFILATLTFFGMWYMVGIDQNPLIASGQLDQFKVFMTTLFIPFAGFYLMQEKLIRPQKIFEIAIKASFVYCSIKVLLMGLHLFGVISVWSVMHKTGLRFMSMNIIGEVGRIQTSVDIATPYLVFFALQNERLGINISNRFRLLYLMIAAFSTFLSFSRLLIFAYALGVFLHGLTLEVKDQVKLWILTAILIIVAVIMAGPQKVEQVVEKRLFSTDNYQSDATRREQIEAMMGACDESPLLGKGLGGYTQACVRDVTLPHAYEVQWIAFLMQFGVLGLCLILLPIFYIGWKLIELPLTISKLCYFTLYSLWLVSGFTNPFLISLTSGFIYLFFLAAADILNLPVKRLNTQINN